MFYSIDVNKYQTKESEQRVNNYSALSRSKSGDKDLHSVDKKDKESRNTGGENLYYGKSKETNRSKQVLIEEIEIPLDEQNLENKVTLKLQTANRDEKVYQRINSTDKVSNKIKSERKYYDSHIIEDHIDKKRKQSDLIIKKSKYNLGSVHQSKSTSPIKHANQSSDDPQSSSNVSFSKNKKGLFQDKKDGEYKNRSKNKKTNRTEADNGIDEYASFLKHQELNTSENSNINPSSVSFKKKSRNNEMREGLNKKYKTPTHMDTDQRDMRIILAQDPKFANQDRQNSRNDFQVYTSNTGGPSLQKDELTNELINQMRVKDYIHVNKNKPVTVSSVTNKKTLEKLTADDSAPKIPNELNDINFYTPSNHNNLISGPTSNQMYLLNKHPMSGSSGYSRGFENDPSL